MNMITYLYTMMNDDLKDSEMLVGYAENSKESKSESMYFLDEAKKRLDGFENRKKKLSELISSIAMKRTLEKDYRDDIVQLYNNHLDKRYDEIENKITELRKLC